MSTLDPGEYTIDELEERLAEVSSPETLTAALETERDGEDRKGAKEVIEDRLNEIEGEGDDATDEGDEGDGDASGSTSISAVIDIRERAQAITERLIGSPLDGVTGVQRDGDEWVAALDVVERPAVPDTQDILGRYEVRFGEGGEVLGYERLTRYRRSDTSDEL